MSVDRLRAKPEGYFTSRWGQPEYTDWLDESLSWKESCYIGDWSFLWERRFRGPDALRLFSDISVNSFASFAIGQSKHVIHTTEAGKVIHEGILTRLAEDELMLFGRGYVLGRLQPAPRGLRREVRGRRLVQPAGLRAERADTSSRRRRAGSCAT